MIDWYLIDVTTEEPQHGPYADFGAADHARSTLGSTPGLVLAWQGSDGQWHIIEAGVA